MTTRVQVEIGEEDTTTEEYESACSSRSSVERPQPKAVSRFRPYFTCAVSLAQLCMLIWLCWTTPFTEIGLSPRIYYRIEPFTFRGNVTVTHVERPNPLIGPPGAKLISLGALFPPCIREDYTFNVYQVQSLQPKIGETEERLGCCEMKEVNAAGTTTKGECSVLSNNKATWREVRCNQRSSSQSAVKHTLRPCCKEDGQCTLSSPQHCWFMKGRFHLHVDHCTQVDCLRQLCILGNDIAAGNYVTQFSPRRGYQWWRFLTSLYLHHGILDYLLITPIQVWLCGGQENVIGWLRMALVYHTAGVGGHLIGSLFTKHDSPQAGAGPAVGGIMGLALAEHVIRRRTMETPGKRLTSLIAPLFALIFLGTVPQVNNFSLLAGLAYGCLSALVFWSRIVFPKKFFLCQFIVVFTIVTIFLFSLALFYGLQRIDVSSFLRFVNCIPYAGGLCD